MKLLVSTQVHENYGSHDWNGEGSCPQYWKAKGGDEYVVYGITNHAQAHAAQEAVRSLVTQQSEYWREYVIGVQLLGDEDRTEYEQWQIEMVGYVESPPREVIVESGVARYADRSEAA